MEVLTVMVIVGILVAMLIPTVQSLKARAEKARCIANMRSLAVAANAYVQDNGHWPQIDPLMITDDYPGYSKAWLTEFQPYGISQKNWMCPTTQRELGNPDLTKPENVRIDYTPMPFDEHPSTPFKWSGQPWFIERSSIHGNGNLIIFTDGNIREALDIIPKK